MGRRGRGYPEVGEGLGEPGKSQPPPGGGGGGCPGPEWREPAGARVGTGSGEVLMVVGGGVGACAPLGCRRCVSS